MGISWTGALMVLIRHLILFTLIFNAGFAMARSKKKIVMKRAKVYHAKKQYRKSNATIRKAYSFKRPRRMPTATLFLVALNYHKMNNHKSALYYFNQLIKKAFLKKHIRVIKALKRDEVDEVNIPKVLKATYYYMGLSYYKLYSKTYRLANAKKAKRYFKICDDVDFNDNCSDYIESLAEKQEVAVKSIKQIEFFVLGSTMLFQDKVNLVSSTGENNTVIAQNSALCYGAGIRYGNAYKGWEVQGCAYSGTATVQDDSSTVNYNQAGVPVAGLIMEGGYYIKPVSDDTRLSVSVPIMYRSGLYSEPEGFTIENAQETKFGLSLNAGWQVWFFEAQMKLAHMGDTNLLSLQGVINF